MAGMAEIWGILRDFSGACGRQHSGVHVRARAGKIRLDSHVSDQERAREKTKTLRTCFRGAGKRATVLCGTSTRRPRGDSQARLANALWHGTVAPRAPLTRAR